MHHAMKEHGDLVLVTHFLNPGTRWRQMVKSMPWLLYWWVKHVLHPLNIRLGWSHSQTVHFEEENILLPKGRIQAQLLSLPDHNIVIILSYPCSQHEKRNILILQICVKLILDFCTNMLWSKYTYDYGNCKILKMAWNLTTQRNNHKIHVLQLITNSWHNKNII